MGWPLFFRLVPGHRIGGKMMFEIQSTQGYKGTLSEF